MLYFVIKFMRFDVMAFSYNKLWKLLIDRNISKAELRRSTGLAPNTMTRMNCNEAISLNVLGRICDVLQVDVGDIIEYVKNDESGEGSD